VEAPIIYGEAQGSGCPIVCCERGDSACVKLFPNLQECSFTGERLEDNEEWFGRVGGEGEQRVKERGQCMGTGLPLPSNEASTSLHDDCINMRISLKD
jgi:hypothetical protein